jgi:hypothetical protein
LIARICFRQGDDDVLESGKALAIESVDECDEVRLEVAIRAFEVGLGEYGAEGEQKGEDEGE